MLVIIEPTKPLSWSYLCSGKCGQFPIQKIISYLNGLKCKKKKLVQWPFKHESHTLSGLVSITVYFFQN